MKSNNDKKENAEMENNVDNVVSQSASQRLQLRSEKVRRLIGEIPPAPVRWGTVIIIAIFIALLTTV